MSDALTSREGTVTISAPIDAYMAESATSLEARLAHSVAYVQLIDQTLHDCTRNLDDAARAIQQVGTLTHGLRAELAGLQELNALLYARAFSKVGHV